MIKIKTLLVLSLFFLVGCKNLTLGYRGDALYIVAPAVYKNDQMFANSVVLKQPFEIRVGILFGEQSKLRGKELSVVVYSRTSCAVLSPISDLSAIPALPLDERLKFTIQGEVKPAGKSFVFKPEQTQLNTVETTIMVEPAAELDTCLTFRAYDSALKTAEEFNGTASNWVRVFTTNQSN